MYNNGVRPNLTCITAIISGLAISLGLLASLGLSQVTPPMMEVNYLGHRTYPGFTRLVFDTGGAGPDAFRVNYDAEGGRVVFYRLQGTLAFTFAPVQSVDNLVRGIDFVQSYGARRGIEARLGPGALGCRASYLSEPELLVLDVYRKTAAQGALPQGRPVRTIALDPGHGGRSKGASGPGGLLEKDITLDLAVRVKGLLAAEGYLVVLTRDKDSDLSPDERAGAANNAHADVYLSIHVAGVFGDVSGGPCVYTMAAGPLEGKSAPLAWPDQNAAWLPDSLGLARELSASLGSLSGGRTPIRQARLAGMEGLTMPAALVEIGCLSDSKLCQSLSNDSYRDRLAGLLAEGINRYAKEVNR